MSATTVTGTSGEDRSDYTREESRAIRQRSLRLLGSLVSPLRWQLVLAAAVLVVSTALRVAGPALIAIGIDTALPAVIQNNDWMPTILVVAIYLTAGIGGAVLIGWYVVVAARLTRGVGRSAQRTTSRWCEPLLAISPLPCDHCQCQS